MQLLPDSWSTGETRNHSARRMLQDSWPCTQASQFRQRPEFLRGHVANISHMDQNRNQRDPRKSDRPPLRAFRLNAECKYHSSPTAHESHAIRNSLKDNRRCVSFRPAYSRVRLLCYCLPLHSWCPVDPQLQQIMEPLWKSKSAPQLRLGRGLVV